MAERIYHAFTGRSPSSSLPYTVRMLKRIFSLADALRLTAHERWVLIVCATHAHRDGRGIALYAQTIAREAGIKRTSVFTALKTLKARGLLVLDKHEGKKLHYRFGSAIMSSSDEPLTTRTADGPCRTERGESSRNELIEGSHDDLSVNSSSDELIEFAGRTDTVHDANSNRSRDEHIREDQENDQEKVIKRLDPELDPPDQDQSDHSTAVPTPSEQDEFFERDLIALQQEVQRAARLRELLDQGTDGEAEADEPWQDARWTEYP